MGTIMISTDDLFGPPRRLPEVPRDGSSPETTYAFAGDLNAHVGNRSVHVTEAERSKWNDLVAGFATLVANAPSAFDTLKEIADWIQTDTAGAAAMAAVIARLKPVATSGSYNDLSDKPTPDSALSDSSANPVQNKVVKAALDSKLTRGEAKAGYTQWEWELVDGGARPVPTGQPAYHADGEPYGEAEGVWTAPGSVVGGLGEELAYGDAGLSILAHSPDATSLYCRCADDDGSWKAHATRHLITPTKTSQLQNDSGFLTQHQDVSGKADKSEMSVTAGTGTDADKTTIQLQTGTFATVLTQHQQLAERNEFSTWTVYRDGVDVTSQGYEPYWDPYYGAWEMYVYPSESYVTLQSTAGIGENATALYGESMPDPDYPVIQYTATRTRLPGYVLGDQTTKPLAGAGDIPDVTGKEDVANKTASFSPTPGDVKYPTERLVKDSLDANAAAHRYGLVDVTNTPGAPYVLASCFPIKYAVGGSYYTASSAENVTIDKADNGNEYWVTIIGDGESTGELVFTTNTDGKYTFQYGTNLTFGESETAPTGNTTQVLGFTSVYALADRAINAVSLSAAATLVTPAANAGHARDLVVRLAVGAAGLNITWGTADAGGVAVDYETEDGEFPDLSEAGIYLVRLTETSAFAAGTGGAEDVPAKFLIQCQPLQTAAAGGAA